MEYQKAVDWVHALPRLGPQPGLTRMKALLQALGNPQGCLQFVHVAGTNGKGSTVAMLGSILAQAGYKVGVNISPYVLDFRERFMINGAMVEEKELAGILSEVKNAADTLDGPPIEFEAVTAAALLYFAQQKCDVVCMEAGIGGMNDATNVIENTLVACITQIGYDHMDLLGNTLREIAADKCGIFKNNCTVVVYPAQKAEAMAEIKKQARLKDCALVIPDVETEQGQTQNQSLYCNPAQYKGYSLQIPFAGQHQVMNASVVVEAALALREKGYAIDNIHIMKGIERAKFPARIEILNPDCFGEQKKGTAKDPVVILDCAHNEDSARALANTLQAANCHGLVGVAGILQDKQAETILALLRPYINVLYTVAPPSPRAIAPGTLAVMARDRFNYKEVLACKTVEEALIKAFEKAQASETNVLIYGSVYLAAEVRAVFSGHKKDGEF